MKKIETKTGKYFSVSWCGESSIDGQLRFYIRESDLSIVFNTFNNPLESEEIKYYMNDTGKGEFKTFIGFTVLKGVNKDNNGITVTLAK